MSRLWLPLGAAIRNPSTERQAIIQKLQKLKYNLIGAPDPAITDISELREHLHRAEEQAMKPQLESPAPRFTKKQIAEALNDFKRFRDERAAGRRRFY